MLFELIVPKFWYKKNVISYALLPFSFIYRMIVASRKFYYQFLPQKNIPVPVIVVGNITVGGTGKTPLVIYLTEFLKNNGYKPGIVSRGYGGKGKNYPLVVRPKSKVEEVGDEALLIAHCTGCPVVVSPKRILAVEKLLSVSNCDVIISDDGLQHYALPRYVEIVLIDVGVGLGNGFCLPAGPLREPPARLNHVDFVVKNYNMNSAVGEGAMVLEPIVFYNIKNPSIIKAIDEFRNKTVHAFAGIGNPWNFFQTLRKLGINVIAHSFPDHYVFKSIDFLFKTGETIILTEKDAVKCESIANENFWCLKVVAKVSVEFTDQLLSSLNKHTGRKFKS